MTCTCYNGYWNPGCEEHGMEAQRAAKKKPGPATAADSQATIVSMPKDDADGMKCYLQLMQRLRAVHRELKEEGQHPSALILVVIDEEQRILSPMILTNDDVKDVLPSVFDTIAEGLRKRMMN